MRLDEAEARIDAVVVGSLLIAHELHHHAFAHFGIMHGPAHERGADTGPAMSVHHPQMPDLEARVPGRDVGSLGDLHASDYDALERRNDDPIRMITLDRRKCPVMSGTDRSAGVAGSDRFGGHEVDYGAEFPLLGVAKDEPGW